MSTLKTKPNEDSVLDFLNSVDDEQKRKDCIIVLELMQRITGEKPVLWGGSIVGFGNYHYKYKSGREGDWFLTGFSPRKQNLTLYIMPGFANYPELMGKLGKYKTGQSCLYLKGLDAVDIGVLEVLMKESVAYMKRFSAPNQG